MKVFFQSLINEGTDTSITHVTVTTTCLGEDVGLAGVGEAQQQHCVATPSHTPATQRIHGHGCVHRESIIRRYCLIVCTLYLRILLLILGNQFNLKLRQTKTTL